jgi:3-oxoacyl-[acyl-carrier-protein] synthase III
VDDYDIFALPQDNVNLLQGLIKSSQLPEKKTPFVAKDYGDVGGASVPLLLSKRFGNSDIGQVKVFACSYGEGLSAGIASFTLNTGDALPLIETDDFYTDGAAEN